MNKTQALHSFWSSFGLPAYDEQSAYDKGMDIIMPYITYSVATDNFDNTVALSASLWYRSTSWAEIGRKAEEIGARLESMMPVPLDGGGYMWLYRRNPFAQRMSDEAGEDIRRIYLSITAEFLTGS